LKVNADKLAKSLVQEYGRLLHGKNLMLNLGFSTASSFTRARKRGLLEVAVFDLEGRQGPFALTEEVAEWMANLSRKASPTNHTTNPEPTGGDMP
jgi:hypothetical protein